MFLCITHGAKGWSGNQLGGEETVQAWGHRAGGWCSLAFLPLFLCLEIIPQGLPLLPMALSLFLSHAMAKDLRI